MKSLNKYIKITLLVLISIFLLKGILVLKNSFKKEFSSKDIKFYINIADNVSKEKVQVNWKYLYAIMGVKYDMNFKKVSEEKVTEIAKMFIEKNDGKKLCKNPYKLVNLEEVLEKLKFTEKNKKKIREYLEQLEPMSIVDVGEKQEKFIEVLKEESIQDYYDSGILPSITIAQAILESAWGDSKLAVNGNNLFGIKADKGWKGPAINMETKENFNDVIKGDFRKYDSVHASMEDHKKFLKENPRYVDVFNQNTYEEQAYALEKAGYSTAKDSKGEKTYAKTLISIIKEYNLQLVDSKAQEEYFSMK